MVTRLLVFWLVDSPLWYWAHFHYTCTLHGFYSIWAMASFYSYFAFCFKFSLSLVCYSLQKQNSAVWFPVGSHWAVLTTFASLPVSIVAAPCCFREVIINLVYYLSAQGCSEFSQHSSFSGITWKINSSWNVLIQSLLSES